MIHNNAHMIFAVIAGLISGILSGAFGVGGAVISTPLIRIIGVSPLLAVGTTIPAVLPSAVTGTLRYTREHLVRWDIVARTAPLGVIAAVAASYLSHAIPGNGHLLMILTAALLAITSYRMSRDRPDAALDLAPPTKHMSAAGLGVLAGVLSGLLGVGGGAITVPGFRQVLHLPLRTAIATSLVCVGIFAVPSTIAHSQLGDIDWRIAGALMVGVVPGARLSSHLSLKAPDHHLRIAVSIALGFIAIIYGASELVALIH